MRRIVVFGATSGIGQAVAQRFAHAGDALHLVARAAERLEAVRADYVARGASAVTLQIADFAVAESLRAVVQRAEVALGGIDIVLMCQGVLPDPAAVRANSVTAGHIVQVNVASVVMLAELVVPVLARSRGVLVLFGSVAGDRGRASNYFYGATKGAVEVFAEGLRHYLRPMGVRVVLVKPGVVTTAMTARLGRLPLASSAQSIAAAIHRASVRGRPAVLYVPWWWRWIMLLIRLLPRAVLHRTRF